MAADSLQHLVKTYGPSTNKIPSIQMSLPMAGMTTNKKIFHDKMRKETQMQKLQAILDLNKITKASRTFWITSGLLSRKRCQLLSIKSSPGKLIKSLIIVSLSLHSLPRQGIHPRIQTKQTKIASWYFLIWGNTGELIFLPWPMAMEWMESWSLNM